jgi:Tfp pilus assembly protein PilO
MTALRPRERRLLVLAGLLVVSVVGYVYVVEPLVEAHRATGELVVARRGLLVRQERLVARTDAYGRELEALRAEIDARRKRLLAGDKAPVAASELQKLVKTTAQEAGIDVRSERILASVDHGGYAEVPVEVTLSGPIRGLTAFLHRLEGAPLLLAVNDLKIRAPATGAARDLSATLALSGFIPIPGGAPAPGGPSKGAGPAPRFPAATSPVRPGA